MKTVAFFIICGVYKNYKFFSENSVNSFKKWHPDIDDVVIVDDEMISECKSSNYAINVLEIAIKMFEKGYTKVIEINADTITCAHFDELLDDTVTPVLATLDFPMDPSGYPYEVTKYMFPQNNFECKNVNAGIICFNNVESVYEMLKITQTVPGIENEQYALQYYMDKNPEKVKVVDFPYTFSPFVYNCRGHGTIGTNCIRNGKLYFGCDGPMIADISPIKLYRPFGDKLYNHLGKHVKMFHFVTRDPDIKEWFNEETIHFFINHCSCDWTLTN